MKILGPLFLAVAAFAAGGAPTHTFTGVITDTMCGANHKMMHVSPESRCVRECVKMDSKIKYALLDGKQVYTLSDQRTPEKFAAQKVKVTGVLNEKTKVLEVESIQPAK